MVQNFFWFATLMLCSLLVGVIFGTWIGYDSSTLIPLTFIEHQQRSVRLLGMIMPNLGLISIIFILILTLRTKGRRLPFSLLLISTAFFIFGAMLNMVFTQPINQEVLAWSVASPPSDWMTVRDKWSMWHGLRTVTGILGLSSLFLAVIFEREKTDRETLKQN